LEPVSTVLWWFARPWSFIWGPLAWQAVVAAAILFLGGLWLGIVAEKREITWATAWGRWLLAKLEQWLEERPRGLVYLTLMITLINASTVLLVIVAAWAPPLSAVLILLAGLNTGVMAWRAGGSRAWIAFLMPHSWIEVPTVVASSAVALQASAATLGLDWFDILADVVWARAFFLRASVPLLLGAAMLEAILMVFPGGREPEDEVVSTEPGDPE
jgi:hypothetical protein